MKTRHHIVIRASCPVDNTEDRYDTFVYVNGRVLKCEEIAAAAEELTREPVFQEQLTQLLANKFCCKVKTRDRHRAGGIETVCVCEPCYAARFVKGGDDATHDFRGNDHR
jgi:hypothetical protein